MCTLPTQIEVKFIAQITYPTQIEFATNRVLAYIARFEKARHTIWMLCFIVISST